MAKSQSRSSRSRSRRAESHETEEEWFTAEAQPPISASSSLAKIVTERVARIRANNPASIKKWSRDVAVWQEYLHRPPYGMAIQEGDLSERDTRVVLAAINDAVSIPDHQIVAVTRAPADYLELQQLSFPESAESIARIEQWLAHLDVWLAADTVPHSIQEALELVQFCGDRKRGIVRIVEGLSDVRQELQDTYTQHAAETGGVFKHDQIGNIVAAQSGWDRFESTLDEKIRTAIVAATEYRKYGELLVERLHVLGHEKERLAVAVHNAMHDPPLLACKHRLWSFSSSANQLIDIHVPVDPFRLSPTLDRSKMVTLLKINDIGADEKPSDRTITRKKKEWQAEFVEGTHKQRFRFRLSTLRQMGVTYPQEWDNDRLIATGE